MKWTVDLNRQMSLSCFVKIPEPVNVYENSYIMKIEQEVPAGLTVARDQRPETGDSKFENFDEGTP